MHTLVTAMGNTITPVNNTEPEKHTGNWLLNVDAGKLHWSTTLYSIFEHNQATFTPSIESYLDTVYVEDRATVYEAYINALERITNLIPENIGITYNLSDSACTINTNQSELVETLIHLVKNARDAMPNGGTLNISTSITATDVATNDTFQEVRIASPNQTKNSTAVVPKHIKISITDTGKGIEQPDAYRVLLPFFSTKKGNKTAGLGLAIVHSFAARNNGYITISSDKDLGTGIHLYLPAATISRWNTWKET